MRRTRYPLLAVLLVTCSGCGEEAAEAPTPMSALEVLKAKFTPPDSGHLTEELLERYVGVLDEQRAHLERTDGARFLDPPAPDATKNQLEVRAKILGEALTQAQMNRGVPMSEMNWTKKRLAQVRLNRTRAPGPETPDGAEVALVDAFQQRTGREL